jgi:hypothetical protein
MIKEMSLCTLTEIVFDYHLEVIKVKASKNGNIDFIIVAVIAGSENHQSVIENWPPQKGPFLKCYNF